MKTIVLMSCILFACLSCGSSKVKNRELDCPELNMKTSYANHPVDGSSKTYRLSLTDVFGLNNPYNTPVKLSFDSAGDLKICYTNVLGGEEFRTFKGKFKKHYFEIYLEKKRIPFPPIYSLTQVNRIRFSISGDGTLVVNRYFNHSAMIVMMAGGSSSREQFHFKQVKTN